jgi:hypothetical protein
MRTRNLIKGGRLAAAATVALPVVAGAIVLAPATAHAAGCDGFRLAADLPAGTINEPYHGRVGAEAGTAPYQAAISHGSLPPELTMDSSGVVSGTPLEPGTFSFQATVTDSSAPACADTETLTLKIGTQLDAAIQTVEDLVAVVTQPDLVPCLLSSLNTLLGNGPPSCP